MNEFGVSLRAGRHVISVIIPVYNVKPYLKDAVDSVIHQSYRDLEIILVDDGSTDGSGEICDEYLMVDNRIKVIHQQNKGLSAARNAGLDVCQGEIISFLDSDDAFCEDMLLKMFNVMESTGADIVECGILNCVNRIHAKHNNWNKNERKTSKDQGKIELFSTREVLRRHLRGESPNYVWNKIYKRKIWEQLRFRDGLNFEDFDIILPVLSRAKMVCRINDDLVWRRRRPQSITNTNNVKNIRDWICAYDNYLRFVKEQIPSIFDAEDYKDALFSRYPRLLNRYYACADLKTNKKELMDEIKQRIENTKHETDVSKHGLKVRTASLLIAFLPPLVVSWLSCVYRQIWGMQNALRSFTFRHKK